MTEPHVLVADWLMPDFDYEPEVLPEDSTLRTCKSIILTSHTAWYSEQSIPDARAAAARNVLEAIVGAG